MGCADVVYIQSAEVLHAVVQRDRDYGVGVRVRHVDLLLLCCCAVLFFSSQVSQRGAGRGKAREKSSRQNRTEYNRCNQEVPIHAGSLLFNI